MSVVDDVFARREEVAVERVDSQETIEDDTPPSPVDSQATIEDDEPPATLTSGQKLDNELKTFLPGLNFVLRGLNAFADALGKSEDRSAQSDVEELRDWSLSIRDDGYVAFTRTRLAAGGCIDFEEEELLIKMGVVKKRVFEEYCAAQRSTPEPSPGSPVPEEPPHIPLPLAELLEESIRTVELTFNVVYQGASEDDMNSFLILTRDRMRSIHHQPASHSYDFRFESMFVNGELWPSHCFYSRTARNANEVVPATRHGDLAAWLRHHVMQACADVVYSVQYDGTSATRDATDVAEVVAVVRSTHNVLVASHDVGNHIVEATGAIPSRRGAFVLFYKLAVLIGHLDPAAADVAEPKRSMLRLYEHLRAVNPTVPPVDGAAAGAKLLPKCETLLAKFELDDYERRYDERERIFKRTVVGHCYASLLVLLQRSLAGTQKDDEPIPTFPPENLNDEPAGTPLETAADVEDPVV